MNANNGLPYWSNGGDNVLQRKDILPGCIFFLLKKRDIKKSWLRYSLIEDGCFDNPIMILRASENTDIVTFLTVGTRNYRKRALTSKDYIFQREKARRAAFTKCCDS